MNSLTIFARQIVTAAFIILPACATTGAHAEDAPSLSLSAQPAETFKCENGKTAETRYYELTDHSLSFIKLSYDGQIHTLPHLPAASGARFSDEFKMEWHAKADSAVMQNPVDKKAKSVVCTKSG